MLSTITDFLKLWRYETPDRDAYLYLKFTKNECQEKRITCKEMYERSCSYGYNFKTNGLKKGDRIIILADQNSSTICSIYGALMAGGIFILVPAPTDKGKLDRLVSTLQSSGAKFITGSKKYKDKIPFDSITFLPHLDFRKKNPINIKELEEVQIDQDDIACLQYTSGSINAPKGVMITHKNIMEAMKIQRLNYPTQLNDVHISWLPYFHTMELTCDIFFSTFTNRKSIFIRVKDFMKKPHRWLQSASKYHATAMTGPISGYLASLNDIDEKTPLDLSSIKYMICSAEPIDKKNLDQIYDKLKNFGLKKNVFYSGYGMTELTTMVAIAQGNMKTVKLDSDALVNGKVKITNSKKSKYSVFSSVGKFWDNTTAVIVNPNTLIQCKEDEAGELWVQCPTAAKGYWNLDNKTQETFKATLNGYDGNFLRTGDLGFMIDNELYLIGRCKEVMIINGRNIYPKDIEYIIKENIEELSHCIIRAFSINVNDVESLIISIEHKDNNTNYERYISQVNALIRENFSLEAYDIFFTDLNGLPRTDNGKVAINKIGNAYLSEDLKIIYSLRHKRITEKSTFNEMQLKIKEIFEEILNVKCTSTKVSFYELGGTSLKVIALIKAIKNTFGITLTIEEILKASTIENIETYIETRH